MSISPAVFHGKNKRSAAVPSFHLSIRAQLMLFLCAMCLFLLLFVWTLIARTLQPYYNKHIYTKLSAQLDTLVAMMDDAIENDVLLSSRFWGQLTLNLDFWGSGGTVDTAIQNGKLSVTNCCLDISDTTQRSIAYSENLVPCLLHEGTYNSFSITAESSRDSASAIRLREKCFSEGSVYEIVTSPSGARQMVVGRVTVDGSYAVLISTNLAQVGEASTVLRQLLPGIAFTLFLVSILAAWLFSRWFTQPLTRLSAAARQMAKGNYTVRVNGAAARSDEIGELAQDFNHMAREVQRTAQLQRDLLANVSHDLRTPLTLIKGYAETVRDLTGGDKEKRDEQMNIVIDETDRLSALVNSVMELSKVSNGTERCEPVDFDMAQLCEEVAERYDGVCAQNNWTLKLELPENASLPVYADPAMMERVLHNLLGNAMHHIGPDGVFVLRAALTPEGDCRVEVEDHGEGIQPDELPYIFDRYYRSRSDAGKTGTGLGLSITKAIFQQHGFRFGVNSAVGRGSVFWFIMKAPQNKKPREEKRSRQEKRARGGKTRREEKQLPGNGAGPNQS